MKLPEPIVNFEHDDTDPTDLGSYRIKWGGYNIYLSSEHANADKPHIYLDLVNGDDDESIVLNKDGSIELGAYGRHTSFKDLHECLSVRQAVRLLKSV